MKTDLAYPKIPDSTNCDLKQCIAFEKYDGTNMHFVWENNQFTRFGTRRDEYPLTDEGIDEFNKNHSGLEATSMVFKTIWLEKMTVILKSLEVKNKQSNTVTLFFEFLGDNSFAGSHLVTDMKYLVLFDVKIDESMLSPQDFIEFTSKLDKLLRVARIVYKGKYNSQLGEDIRNNKYNVFEGVVVKGVVKNKSVEEVRMIKIKTNKYMAKLKESFKEKWIDYWE